MDLGRELEDLVARFASLSRWEKSELGRELRRMGLSYGEIMELIPVKKSTLATWCSGVDLTPQQVEAIRSRRTPEPGKTLSGERYTTQSARRQEIQLIEAQAKLEAEHLVRDPLWTAGVALYWGEGAKTQRKLSLANSDPGALRLFKKWTETYLTPEYGWRARINLHADNDEPSARIWWVEELDIDIEDFTKTYVKPDGTGHRKNHLPYGVCTLIKRRGTNDFYRTLAWVDFMKSRFGS